MALALVSSLGVTLGILLFFVGLVKPRKDEGAAVESRLTAYGSRIATLEERELQRPFSERVVKPIIERLSSVMASRTPQQSMEGIRRKLDLAGNPNNMTVSDFLGLRLFGALAGFGGAILITWILWTGSPFLAKLLAPVGLGFMGFNFPNMWLNGKIGARQKEAVKAMPDALDLLTISVEAGMGFEQGLSKVAEKWENALTLEFRRMLREQQLGKSRRESLRAMAERLDVPDVSAFVAAIIQADQLGVSIARILQVQSEDMRTKRRQRIEQQVAVAPLKMTFPMVLFMMPALWIIILGPIVPLVANMMKK